MESLGFPTKRRPLSVHLSQNVAMAKGKVLLRRRQVTEFAARASRGWNLQLPTLQDRSHVLQLSLAVRAMKRGRPQLPLLIESADHALWEHTAALINWRTIAHAVSSTASATT